jgi:hypothetical protein
MINPNIAFLAPFLLFFGQVRSFFSYLSRFVFWKDSFEHDIGAEVEMWLRDNCKLLPHLQELREAIDGHIAYGKYRGHMRPKALVLFPAQPLLIFVKSWRFPVPYFWDLKTSTLRYFVGTFPRKKLWEHLTTLRVTQLSRTIDNEAEEERNPVGGGFFLSYLNAAAELKAAGSTRSRGGSGPNLFQGVEATPAPVTDSSSGFQDRYYDRWILDPLYRNTWSRYLPHVHRDCISFPEAFRDLSDVKRKDPTLPYGVEKEILQNDFRNWLRMREWCESRALPWRRGALLYGAPGTGKSAMIREIAIGMALPIYVIDLSQCTNAYLQGVLENAQWTWPCIFLFEDIDGIFNGREYVAPRSMLQDPVTFDALLQFLGGAVVLNGVYVVMTTNHLDKLDDALVRKGRIDVQLEVKGCSKEHIRRLCDHVFFDDKETADLLYNEIEEGTPVSAVSHRLREKASEILNQKINNEVV